MVPALDEKRTLLIETPSYKKTLLNEQFLLHDSGPPPQSSCIEDPNTEEERKEEAGPWVIVFATQKNIEIVC